VYRRQVGRAVSFFLGVFAIFFGGNERL